MRQPQYVILDQSVRPTVTAFVGTRSACLRHVPAFNPDDEQQQDVQLIDIHFAVGLLVSPDDRAVVALYRECTGAKAASAEEVSRWLHEDAHLDFAQWFRLARLVHDRGLLTAEQFDAAVIQHVTRNASGAQSPRSQLPKEAQ